MNDNVCCVELMRCNNDYLLLCNEILDKFVILFKTLTAYKYGRVFILNLGTNSPSRRKADFLKMNTTILVTLVTLSMAAIPRSREVRDDVFSVIESDVSITEEIRDETEEIEEQGGVLVDHDDAQLEERLESSFSDLLDKSELGLVDCSSSSKGPCRIDFVDIIPIPRSGRSLSNHEGGDD